MNPTNFSCRQGSTQTLKARICRWLAAPIQHAGLEGDLEKPDWGAAETDLTRVVVVVIVVVGCEQAASSCTKQTEQRQARPFDAILKALSEGTVDAANGCRTVHQVGACVCLLILHIARLFPGFACKGIIQGCPALQWCVLKRELACGGRMNVMCERVRQNAPWEDVTVSILRAPWISPAAPPQAAASRPTASSTTILMRGAIACSQILGRGQLVLLCCSPCLPQPERSLIAHHRKALNKIPAVMQITRTGLAGAVIT